MIGVIGTSIRVKKVDISIVALLITLLTKHPEPQGLLICMVVM